MSINSLVSLALARKTMWLGGGGYSCACGPVTLKNTPCQENSRCPECYPLFHGCYLLFYLFTRIILFSLCNKFIKELKKIAFLLMILAGFLHHEASQSLEWAFGKSLFGSKAVWVSAWRWEARTHSCLPKGDIQGMILGYLWNKQRGELGHGERWDLGGAKSSETCIFVVSFHSWSWDANSDVVGSLGMT